MHAVFGFNTTVFSGMERGENYAVEVGFLSGISPTMTTASIALSLGTAGICMLITLKE